MSTSLVDATSPESGGDVYVTRGTCRYDPSDSLDDEFSGQDFKGSCFGEKANVMCIRIPQAYFFLTWPTPWGLKVNKIFF